MGRPVRIMILVRGFGAGGAERQLLTLLQNCHNENAVITVACFYHQVWHAQAEGHPNIRIVDLCKGGRYDIIGLFRRMVALFNEFHPDVIYGYGGSAWLPALLLGKLKRTKVVWGIRNSEVIPQYGDHFEVVSANIFRYASRYVNGFIANSAAGARSYSSSGYPLKRITVIPNGIDARKFYRDAKQRDLVRSQWNVAPSTRLVGLVARADPLKEHATFLRAAALLKKSTDLQFACVGVADGNYTSRLQILAEDLGIAAHVKWIGYQANVVGAYNALDVNVLCSGTEGFPNSLCEAMACETPCVATDVGDCAEILRGLSPAIPFQDPVALAAGIEMMLNRDRSEIGTAMRARVVEDYSVSTMVKKTISYFSNISS